MEAKPLSSEQISDLKSQHAVYKSVEEGNFYQSVKDLPGGGPDSTNGLLSSLKIIWTKKPKKIYSMQERPPYPILIERPTLVDVVKNIGKPDIAFLLTFYFTGIFVSFAISRNQQNLAQRLILYRAVSRCFTTVGVGGMFLVPYHRLTGFWDNGLRWRFPEKQIDRSDFMTEYLKTSYMKHFYQKS